MKKTMKMMLGFAALVAAMLCANRAEAGLQYGGFLTGKVTETVTLNGGKFYNLTDDTTIDLRADAGLIHNGIEILSGTVVINLNGHNLSVYGSPGLGRMPGAAGVYLPSSATLYVVGRGTFLSRGGDPGNGGKGGDGTRGFHSGDNQICGSGGNGGDGGGGGGASVGLVGAVGGKGGSGETGQTVKWELDLIKGYSFGRGGDRGSDGDSGSGFNAKFGTFRVVTATVKTDFPALKNGLDGVGGNCGGYEKYDTGGIGSILNMVHAIGGGGGGGGGAAGWAPTSVLGYGGTSGGGGGGGGSGGVNNWEDVWKGDFINGGQGGDGGSGTGAEAKGVDAYNVAKGTPPWWGKVSIDVGGGGHGGWRSSTQSESMHMESVSATAIAATQYAVTLDHQGGTGADTAICYLGEVPGKVAVPVRLGHAFHGYYTEPNALGDRWFNEKGEASSTWDTDAKTLYAYWTVCSYTVTLNANGGAGGTASVTATFGQDLPSVSVPEWKGCTFNGFFDAKTGGTKYYNANGTSARVWDKGVNTTLYAQWTGNTYVVTLPDGTKVDVTYGQKSPNVKPVSKPGYTFNGYGDTDGNKYYNANGTPTGETWSTPSDVTLEPLFTANTYTITLDAQGGEGGTASVKATYDALLPKIAVPTLKGHTFLGYFDAAEDGTQCYDDAGNSMVTWDKEGDATLYAHWAVTIYTLTFDQQGGEGGTEFASVEYLAELPKVKIPALTGHTFLGYFDGTDEEAVKYYESNGGSTNVYEWLENKTLSAKWKANSYKYVLDGGAFTGELAVVYGRAPSNLPRVPQDEENVFMGYFDEEGNMVYDAGGKYVGESASYAVVGNTNLKAMWSEKPEVIRMIGEPKQRWPWNGKYDITYTAESLKAKNLYVVNVEMTVTEPGKTEPKTYTRLVQISSENGEHTLTADFGKFVAPETLDANATIRLRLFLTDSGEEKAEEE